MALPHFSFRLQLPGQELDSGAAEAAADLATPLPRSDPTAVKQPVASEVTHRPSNRRGRAVAGGGVWFGISGTISASLEASSSTPDR